MSTNSFVSYGNPGRTGSKPYGINDLSVFRKAILTVPGTTVATIAAAKLQSTWIALAKNPMASRIFPFPMAVECKPAGGTTIMAKTALSGDVPIREDVSTIVMSFIVNPVLATELRKCNRKKWEVLFVDAFDNIIGWTPDGTKLQGFTTTAVFFGQMSNSDGSKARENELHIVLANPKEWNDSPAVIMGDSLDWYPSQLDGTVGVKVAVTAATTAGFTTAVSVLGIDPTDPRGAIVGLAKADFALYKAGVSTSLSAATMVDNGDGTYTFTMTNTSGNFTLGLITPPSGISVVAYNIESPVAGSFSIS
jgi:hypothetical protein